MSVESASYINQLDATRPTSSDLKSEGDNHLRLLKVTIQNSFPNITGAVNPTHTQLNYVVGVTSAIQTQLDAKAPLASPALTGTPTVPTAATVTTNTQAASTAFVHNVLDSLGDATLAAATAQADIATTQAGIATTQAGISTTKAGEAATSASNVALTEQLNLGSKTSNPTLDNQGNALLAGALYYNSVADETRVYTGSSWKAAGSAVNGTSARYTYTATAAQTTFAAVYDTGFVDVYLNGIKLIAGTDFTATSGTNIVLATGAALNDTVDIVGYGAFEVANTYTQAQTDALLAGKASTASVDAKVGGNATDNIGYLSIPQNSQSTAYTCVLADSGKHILHPSADTTARTFTIPANASVAYPVGTAITFINQNAAGVVTIAITTDTMRLAGAGTTGSRTLAANGIATAIKLTSTEWMISGTGLT